jgi:hypothetical protein
MGCSIEESDEHCTNFNDEAGMGSRLSLSDELLTAVVRLEKMIHKARRAAGLSDDQKWRLVCAGSLVGVAGSHLKIFSERRG